MSGWRTTYELGHGKFGVVNACVPVTTLLSDEPQHAIKRLRREYASDEELRQRFAREIEILASLKHPNLMPVLDHGETDDGIPWLVMPLASEGSLRDAMADGRADDRDWWVGVFEGVLAGVGHAHDRGIIHRDLKPRNILLHAGKPLVSDFGIAKQLELDATTLTKSAQELGTLRYMAPEQFASSKSAKIPADVYALGKIFAHLITGIAPEPMKVDIVKVPEKFRFFVDKCCREDPQRRYADATAALEGFRSCLVGYEVQEPAEERLQELASRAERALGSAREEAAIEELDAHVRANRADEDMNRSVIPYLPNDILRAWLRHNPEGFREALEGYDSHISESGSLVGTYCDVVADFYAAVFRITPDLTAKRLIMERLLDLGYAIPAFTFMTSLLN